MSVSYTAISWNRHKKIYDLIIMLFVLFYLTLFITLNLFFNPNITEETLIIRSTSTLAFLLLHIILAVGPLCRLNTKFLPLLYNRRHLGITMFCIAAVHGVFSILQFHTLGNTNPLLSVFVSNKHYNSYLNFPFQSLGFFALMILMLMAFTSHDFWLNNLSPKFWKTMHMFVYVAYFLIIMHVMLGVIQLETSPVFVSILGFGAVSLITLHLLAALKENKKDKEVFVLKENGFYEICDLNDIENNRAKVACLDGERIAIFKYDSKLSAVSNVCKHQNGPLGEGKIIDGCITCPWHGFQYQPHNGRAPKPFDEKLKTYYLKLSGTKIWLNPKGNEEGTAVEPLVF